jgi:hypothetical protein
MASTGVDGVPVGRRLFVLHDEERASNIDGIS